MEELRNAMNRSTALHLEQTSEKVRFARSRNNLFDFDVRAPAPARQVGTKEWSTALAEEERRVDRPPKRVHVWERRRAKPRPNTQLQIQGELVGQLMSLDPPQA
jgi:hypothetical protein